MLFNKISPIFSILLFVSFVTALAPQDLLITILSQQEGYNAAQAKLLQSNIQSQSLHKEPPEIILSHKLDVYGSWTIVPLIPYLYEQNKSARWYIFCLENTAIDLNKLLNVLNKYDADIYKKMWIGNALYDKEPTITHHYAEHSKRFKYPNLGSGFAMSKHLFESLVNKAKNYISPNRDFNVDASYEFATFVLNESKGTRLTHVSEFCDVFSTNCATYPKPFHACDKIRLPQKIYVAVKTCAKYHVDRLKFIKKTWARHAENIGYFTNELDENLPNGYLTPDTEEGHCSKTFSILKQVAPILKEKKLDWLLITDDDTIISMARLLRMLTCYNPADLVAIGERYGFRSTQIHGYDYLTGGAGVVLSTQLVLEMIKPKVCDCPSSTTPDDMFLFGVCLAQLGIKVTHSPLFHQARPKDYATVYLATKEPISFHQYANIDPIQVYKEWFEDDDDFLPDYSIKHSEL
ncbi:hypothetical protein TKK_0013332 [Trichogramma kaykai]|uniref:Fringe-like glycosyltransferase domain-containing protein n=1 Tax=Trichogramma kaykai TaxID=54128 RepID=A0ABD2WJL3_9HYME